MYTFSFVVGNIIPKSVKCIHSATKLGSRVEGFGVEVSGYFVEGLTGFRVPKDP